MHQTIRIRKIHEDSGGCDGRFLVQRDGNRMEPVCIHLQVPSHMLLAIKDGARILATLHPCFGGC